MEDLSQTAEYVAEARAMIDDDARETGPPGPPPPAPDPHEFDTLFQQ